MEQTRDWTITRVEFGLAVGALLLPVVLFLGRPSSMGGGSPGDWSALDPLVVAGYAGMLLGLSWMWRIYRAPVRESESSSFRYRDHG